MKNRFARVLMLVLAFALLAVGHSGCGGGYGSKTPAPVAPNTTPMPTPRY